MGVTKIKSSSISYDFSNLSSIEHAARAASQCLEQSGVNKGDIDLLINVGVYRDNNMGEPAMAALIQQKIGLNLDPARFPVNKMTFSFDLMNGACGFVNAVQVVDSLMRLDNIHYAIIVAGDAHPSCQSSPDFPYSSVGSAMFLEMTHEEGRGFQKYAFSSSQDASYGLQGSFNTDITKTKTRHSISIKKDEDYVRRLSEFTVATLQNFLKANELNPAELCLVNPYVSPDFGKHLCESLGFPCEKLVHLPNDLADVHTTSPIAGYHFGAKEGFYTEGSSILFVTAGSGLSVACSLYKE